MDFVATDRLNGVTVMLGVAPDLAVSISHGNGFSQGQTGSYLIAVGNVGFAPSQGLVEATVAVPQGFTATNILGAGWICVLSTLTCDRSDPVVSSTSYPPIRVTGNVTGNITDSVTATAVILVAGDDNTSNNIATDTTTIRLATTISLNSSQNPSLSGQGIILTATVTPAATGKVTFYDSTTALGTADLSGGQATLLTTPLASGTRSLFARYAGDANHSPRRSGVYAQSVGSGPSNGILPRLSFKFGKRLRAMAAADFNRDGKPDLAVLGDSAVSILLGNGDGTFAVGGTAAVASDAYDIASSDFNLDGKFDVLVSAGNSVSILLGNGDATLQSGFAIANAGWNSLNAADLNADGILDLVGINYQSNSVVAMLRGNGDGTFQSPVNILTTGVGTGLGFVKVADFNGDGKPDLISQGYTYTIGSNFFVVLLGNGDGTFQPGFTAGAPSCCLDFSVGDFNNDGRVDVLTYSGSPFPFYTGSLAVMLGNGEGTLQPGINTALEVPFGNVLAVDVNGDGRLDVVYGAIAVGLGKGDGTFSLVYPSGVTPAGRVTTADFDGSSPGSRTAWARFAPGSDA